LSLPICCDKLKFVGQLRHLSSTVELQNLIVEGKSLIVEALNRKFAALCVLTLHSLRLLLAFLPAKAAWQP
jgi:hypothetical protein